MYFEKLSVITNWDRIDLHLKFGLDVKTDDATDVPEKYCSEAFSGEQGRLTRLIQ